MGVLILWLAIASMPQPVQRRNNGNASFLQETTTTKLVSAFYVELLVSMSCTLWN